MAGCTERLIVCAAMLLGVRPAAAGPRAVSFAEARRSAERLGAEVQLAERHTDIARAEVRAAGALGNPLFGVTSAKETARLGLSLLVPVPLFGQRGRTVAAARADADAVQAETAVARSEARWRASMAWLDLFEAEARATQLELAAQGSSRVEEIASLRFEAGRGPRVDVVRTRADRARAHAEAVAAHRLVSAAAARLTYFIGAEPSEPLTAAGAASYPSRVVRLDELSGHLHDHPILRRDRAQVIAAEAHVRSEQRSRWPIVNAQLTLNQFDPTLSAPDVIGGLSFELPVLSLRGGAIARAQALRLLAEVAGTLDGRLLRVEVLDAFERSEAARDKLTALRTEVLPAIEEAKHMTEEAYETGRVELIRLLDAQRALIDSRLAEIDAATTWARALAELERATGVDLGGGGP